MVNRVRRSMTNKDQGFTLIELLVVIIIIGVLAAIAIPVFLNQRKKAVDASLKSDLKNAATQVETWMGSNPGIDIPGSGWATSSTDAGGSLTGLKVSPGNLLSVKPSQSAPSGGYCINAYNPGASEATYPKRMVYLSLGGGLQTFYDAVLAVCT